MRSSNGSDFSQVDTNIIPTDKSVLSITESNNVIYVGTDVGLYKSEDNGSTFSLVTGSDIAEDKIVGALYYDSVNKKTYIGSDHNKMFMTSNNSSFEDISYNSNEVGNITDINSTLYIGGDNNFDGTDTQGLWYYAI